MMHDDDLHDRVVRLEDRIEDLAGAIENCRKFILVSRLAIAGGGVVLLALAVGAIAFSPMAMVGAFAAMIGGTVLAGSNRSTSQQAAAALAAAEAERAELIGQIDLRVVGGGNGLWSAQDAPRPPTIH
jgi:hypothetical protein